LKGCVPARDVLKVK